VASRVVHVVPT